MKPTQKASAIVKDFMAGFIVDLPFSLSYLIHKY
jgi:hypothetical protein